MKRETQAPAKRKGKFHYADKVHYENPRGEGPLCGAFSVMGWHGYGNPEAETVTCKSCLRIEAQAAKRADRKGGR